MTISITMLSLIILGSMSVGATIGILFISMCIVGKRGDEQCL